MARTRTDFRISKAAPWFGALTAPLFAPLFALLLAPLAHASDANIVLTIKEHQFTPSDVPVRAGQKLKLVIRNADAVTAEFESVDFHREKLVQAGSEIAVFVGPLEPGSYEFFDDLHPATRGRLIAR